MTSGITRRGLLVGAATIGAIVMLDACGVTQKTQVEQPDGWWMPAEEEPHQQTWMAFPSSSAIWGPDLADVQSTIAEIALAIAAFEPVSMLVRPAARGRARSLVGDDVELIDAPVDDLWARDTLPCFLVSDADARLGAGVLRFNGWGGKQLHTGDRQLARLVAEQLDCHVVDGGITGEGGGLEVDGEGTVLAARSSWVNTNRNPGLSEREIDLRLMQTVGAERIVWVDGLAGQDITDGHIDTLARFIDPTTILLEDPGTDDIWGRTAARTREQVEAARTVSGDSYDVVTLEQPVDVPSSDPNFLASYVNYYVCNGGLIMPAFGDRTADRLAREELAQVYPDREIVQLRIDAVAAGGGGIHCATQQQPAQERGR